MHSLPTRNAECHPELSMPGAPEARQRFWGKRSEGSASRESAHIGSKETYLGAPSLRLKGSESWLPQFSLLRPGKTLVASRRLRLILKSAQALLLAVAVIFWTAASTASIRFNDLGHRLMCTCSCAQLLGECNHVGCPESGQMRDELSAAIASGATDEQILSSFAAKYGATVLAAPTTHGFDLVAWIAPVAVFLAALLGTILLVRRWSLGSKEIPVPVSDPAMNALRDKIRRETEATDL
jgi:cytochrome c-type biogenesis protein CcmH/NrfF